MRAPYEIRSIEYLGEYRLRVGFADGTFRNVDLGTKLAGLWGRCSSPFVTSPSLHTRR
jgi:hypothetical protein